MSNKKQTTDIQAVRNCYRVAKEGGYGVQPRWCDKVRKGKMRAYFSRVMMPEEYKEMSNDELYDIIQKELYVNDASVTGNFYPDDASCNIGTGEASFDVYNFSCVLCGDEYYFV